MTQDDASEKERKTLLESGLVTEDQVKEGLVIQEEVRSMGIEPESLARILVLKGYLTEEQALGLYPESPGGEEGVLEIPGYEIMGTIGKGGMGTVYKAFQKSMARDVAIKVLFPGTARRPGYVERFFREARMAARVKHTNIIQAFDVGEHQGHFFLVMEYSPGRTLKTIIFEDDRIPCATALEIVLQIARALEHAHANNLIHQDVKPENILINEEGVAKLCDMGLAKELSPGAGDKKEAAGTPLYVSPEQALGAAELDIRSDIYSLGATFYHMILGRPPFLGTDPKRIVRMHIEDPLVPPAKRDPSVPKAVSDVIVKMMEKKPEARYRDPSDLISHLERVRDAAGKPAAAPAPAAPVEVAAPPPETEPVPGKKAKYKKFRKGAKSMAPVLILVIVAVVLVVGGLMMFRGEPPSPEEPDGRKPVSGKSAGGKGVKGGSASKGKPDVTPDPVKEVDPAESLFLEAEAYRRLHPKNIEEAISRFQEAAEKGKDSHFGRKAARRVESLQKKKAEKEKAAFDKVVSEAAAFEGQNRLGWAITLYQNFLLLPDIDDARREKSEKEVERLSVTLAGRWTADQAAVEEMAARGAFDDAIQVVKDSVDRDRGYATKDTLAECTGVDADDLLESLERRKTEWGARTSKEAAHRLAELETKWKRFLATGARPGLPDAKALPLVDRFRVMLRMCDEALADPALATESARCRSWRKDMLHVVTLTGRLREGFRSLAKNKARVKLRTKPTPSVVAGLVKRGRQTFVKFSSPGAMIALDQTFEELEEGSLLKVLHAAAESGPDVPGVHLALGLLYLWSTPGEVPDAVKLAETELALASAQGMNVGGYLAVLKERKGMMDEASIRRLIDDALVLAKSTDRKKREEALKRLSEILTRFAESPALAGMRSEIEKAVDDLKKKSGPPVATNIPFLNGKALAFNELAGTFKIKYEFSRPQEISDWTGRTHGDLPDQWFQHVLNKFLGRGPRIQLSGGKANVTGGGFLMWNPRLSGDLEVEMDFCPLHLNNYFVLLLATDEGGYGFHPEIDMRGLSQYGQQAGVTIPTGAGPGLSEVNLKWPQNVSPIREDYQLTLRPKTWYKFKFTRKGNTLSAAVMDRRSRPVKTLEIADDRHTRGRFGFALLKSGLIFDNVLIKGTLEEEWYRRAREGREEGETGDMPGEEVR